MPNKADIVTCALCLEAAVPFAVVDQVQFLECNCCDFIFADPLLLARVDSGEPLRVYDEAYWHNELASARDRSFGSSLARFAEAVLYCRIPIQRFIDIGTGPGFLLDALSQYLPEHRLRFHGVEKFPPLEQHQTRHPNYHRSDLAELSGTFECGICVEVLEHLTPQMARQLAIAMAKVSTEGSLFLFNTGLTDYVKQEDPGYLDPYVRGHITCWSVKAARRIFEPHGFQVHALRGKAWAFILEFTRSCVSGFIEDRIWTAPEANRALLCDCTMGSVMYILGRESARAY